MKNSNISALEIESIKASFQQSIALYPEAYQLSSSGPSLDAICSIAEWVKTSRDVEDNPKGTENDWLQTCARVYVDLLENDEEELNENYNWCMEKLLFSNI